MTGYQGKVETVIGCHWLMFVVLEAVMVYCSELWHVLSAHPDSLHLITVDVPPEAENIPRVQQSESTYKINCCFVYTIFVMCHYSTRYGLHNFEVIIPYCRIDDFH